MTKTRRSQSAKSAQKVLATLVKGKHYRLMVPNSEQPRSPNVIEFRKGNAVEIDKATQKHLEEHAFHYRETRFANGEIDREKCCSFEFSEMTR